MNSSQVLDIIANISFIVSIIFFFFAVIQLIDRKRLQSAYYLSVIFTAVGVQCLSFFFYFNDSPIFERFFYYSDTAFLFLIGSFLYLFFFYISSDTKITKRTYLHAVPFFICLIFIQAVNLYYPELADKKELPVIEVLEFLSYFSLFVYLILILKTLRSYYIKQKVQEIKFLIYVIICSIVFSFILLLSNTMWKGFQYISHIAFLCIPLSFIVFLIRYPDYLKTVQKESQETRYRYSQIENLDKDEICTRLDNLLENGKIYTDKSLSVKFLSVRLNITSAQLSELLTSRYKTNYNNLINSHRVEAVKEILIEKPDANLLEAAFDCGFNSKTTFNTAFKKFTGLTPTEYKKQISS